MPTLECFTSAAAPGHRLNEIHAMVEAAFGGRFEDEDWDHCLGGWHVIAVEAGAIRSHAAVVRRVLEVGDKPFDTGYVEAVATDPTAQRIGLGSAVMAEVAELIRHEYDLGALSTGRHEFFARLGWEPWRGPTYVRRGSDLIRTPEEDDGVMVYRFGPSAGIDLTTTISCDARPGDDW